MEELDRILKLISEQKGGTPKDYRLLMNLIGHLESGNITNRKQMEGGPGRGIYQFEMGKNASAISAARRARNFYARNKMEAPKWIKDTKGQTDLDASKLTKEQQSLLFLADKMERKGSDFSQLWDGSKSVEDFYLDSHWAGRESKRADKRAYFRRDAGDVLQNEQFSPGVKTQGTASVPYYVTPGKSARETLIEQFSPKDNKPIENERIIQQEPAKNTYKFGGNTGKSYSEQGDVSSYNNGGTHAQNPLGGIPIGLGANGKMDTVEEGETSFESSEGKYIFSNLINLDGTINKR